MRLSFNSITVCASAIAIAIASLPRQAVAQESNGCWYTDSEQNCNGSAGHELCVQITSQAGCSWDGTTNQCSYCGAGGCHGYNWTLSCCNVVC